MVIIFKYITYSYYFKSKIKCNIAPTLFECHDISEILLKVALNTIKPYVLIKTMFRC